MDLKAAGDGIFLLRAGHGDGIAGQSDSSAQNNGQDATSSNKSVAISALSNNAPAVYRAVTASKPPARRITLGYAALAAARQVWVLASGTGKEAALGESLTPEGTTPLARLIRMREHTVIFTEIKTGA